ncbi:hypothetical protein [Sporolactobacillus laevolacticus]|uniref:hypothetical protein n=1 Tax=Sporolactobacillus laevolacticus TaxID=33018 RepID=UPI0025B5FAAA|nr:hypothetical protein [Sporolactobacillus laevolacticus]MDN3956201.1 hypothetical protein [Sporolactobacillus laevolacticus]
MANRKGEVTKNRLGYKMEICEYNSDIDLWVRFIDGYKVHTNWQKFKMGLVRNPNNRSICKKGYMGIGEYNSKDHLRAFQCWQNMLRRCYDKKTQEKHPSYKGIKVNKEFLCFQNFAQWYYDNYWEFENEKMHIDKDLLQWNTKEKIYSPDTVVVIPEILNKTIENKSRINVEHYYRKYRITFRGKRYTFDSENEAIKAYCKMKEEHIHELAEQWKEKLPERVYNGMKNWRMAA